MAFSRRRAPPRRRPAPATKSPCPPMSETVTQRQGEWPFELVQARPGERAGGSPAHLRATRRLALDAVVADELDGRLVAPPECFTGNIGRGPAAPPRLVCLGLPNKEADWTGRKQRTARVGGADGIRR